MPEVKGPYLRQVDSNHSIEMTELWCPKHGAQRVAPIYAGTMFCEACIKEHYLNHGVRVITERKVELPR